MALSPHSGSIVERFRCALEACDKAHAQVPDATPCAHLPLRHGPLEGGPFPPVALLAPPAPLLPPGAAVPTVPPTLFPVQTTAEPPAQPEPVSLGGSRSFRHIIYAIVAAAAVALVVYLRARWVLPMFRAWCGKGQGDKDEEDSPVPHRADQLLMRRRATQEKGAGRVATAARLGVASQDLHEASAPTARKAVDLRRVHFQKQQPPPAPETQASFFESAEPDPNFVPI